MKPEDMDAETAANHLARVLEEEGRAGGRDVSGIRINPPEDSPEEGWQVVWGEGPRNWGMYLSSGESIQFTLSERDRWRSPTGESAVHLDFWEKSNLRGVSNDSLEQEFPDQGETWYLETHDGQDVIFVQG